MYSDDRGWSPKSQLIPRNVTRRRHQIKPFAFQGPISIFAPQKNPLTPFHRQVRPAVQHQILQPRTVNFSIPSATTRLVFTPFVPVENEEQELLLLFWLLKNTHTIPLCSFSSLARFLRIVRRRRCSLPLNVIGVRGGLVVAVEETSSQFQNTELLYVVGIFTRKSTAFKKSLKTNKPFRHPEKSPQLPNQPHKMHNFRDQKFCSLARTRLEMQQQQQQQQNRQQTNAW